MQELVVVMYVPDAVYLCTQQNYSGTRTSGNIIAMY